MNFIDNSGLFTQAVLDLFSQNDNYLYIPEADLEQSEKNLTLLINYWQESYLTILTPVIKKNKITKFGVPEGFELSNSSETEIEQGLIRKTLEIIGFENKIANNKSLTGSDKADRPDMILFSSSHDIQTVNQALQKDNLFNGRQFCKSACFILEAKRTTENTDDTKHIKQTHDYLLNYSKEWGILSNGLSWRLIHKNNEDIFLRFDLVLFLQQFIGKNKRKINSEDSKQFALFEHLFGSKAHASGFLANLYSETEKALANLREILRENAHNAVEQIATGLWINANNRSKGWLNEHPKQIELDYLREQSLILLYRLLFILKAESRDLLIKYNGNQATAYAQEYALSHLLAQLEEKTPEQLTRPTIYRTLQKLFQAIDVGDPQYGVPAYNGGLFDAEIHKDLFRWEMTDAALKAVLSALMYADKERKKEIVWKELDVRDLGDVYEGLLEQRLILDKDFEVPTLTLKNENGERKTSGSYFTPDSLVTQLVNKTLLPLLDACDNNPNTILELKVLDPSMGSGHFLVKAIDIMSRYLAMHCNPKELKHPDKGIKNTNDATMRTYWKIKVVENCIYGVDYNPMSVELAKVAIWLHTADYEKPLSFLSHHLKVGNALLGVDIEDLKEPALEAKKLKSGLVWQVKTHIKNATNANEDNLLSKQMGLFFIDEDIIGDVLSHIRILLASASKQRQDVHNKRINYEKIVKELSAYKLLADLWCAQWFFVEPDEQGIKAFSNHGNSLYNRLLRICTIKDSSQREIELEKFKNNSFVKMVKANTEHGYGARPTLFFHWQLEFPEVAFDNTGHPKSDYGFDVVLGNPPWDKIKPEIKPFYAPYSVEVANTQGASIKKLVHELEKKYPELKNGWLNYENTIQKTVNFLKVTGYYQYQSTLIDDKKTGGDPDLFRFFIERAYKCVRAGGRVGLVAPAALWQAEGCTALRQLLLRENTIEHLYTFENFRKWAFGIHTSFKFTGFVFKKQIPDNNHSFPAGFMLRNIDYLDADTKTMRLMQLSLPQITALSPDTLALLDFKSAGDNELVAKLHKNFLALGKSDWVIKYRCELHMTNDAHLFRDIEWMKKRAFSKTESSGGIKYQRELDMSNDAYLFRDREWMIKHGFNGLVSESAEFYENRAYSKVDLILKNKQILSVYIHPDDKKIAEENPHLSADHFYIVPNETYVPLYEGRMVHIFDHCQKAYFEGEGRKAKWEDLDFNNKALKPRAFVSLKHAQIKIQPKLGFCDVTGATNERSTLVCLLPEQIACGNKVPTFTFKEPSITNLILLQCLMSSFVWDFLIRLRISMSMTMNFLNQIPAPKLADINETLATELCERAVKLSCTTPEMARYWNTIFPDIPWTTESATYDLKERAILRAEIDARIAKLYNLSVEEYARILTHFPLLDRKFKPLEGDKFIADGTDEIKIDRAFITRDLALHHYILYLRQLGEKIPFIDNLENFYRDKVELDPSSEESRFRIGIIKDLEKRIAIAIENGSIAYIPS